MGIEILLLLVILVVGVAGTFGYRAVKQVLRHGPDGDLGPPTGEDPRPVHRLAEPDDEHAVGFGVGGEHGGTPQPARVADPPPTATDARD